ncbi:MAG TPA: hypothetical protein VI702_03445 [Nitrospiria bacterium]
MKAEGTKQIKEGELYKERAPGVKFPRIVRIRKIAPMGPLSYVFYMAENQAAMAAHPNGGFIPFESFLTLWEPVNSIRPNNSEAKPKK